MNEIQNLLMRKEFSTADLLIDDRLKSEPDNADAHYLRALSLYFQGNFTNAVESLRKSLTIDPKHTDAAICLSVLFNDVGKYTDAKKVFEQANQSVSQRSSNADLGIDKKFAVKHLELADLYFRYRRYDEAIAEYTKASLLDPTTTEIRIRLAKSYAKRGLMSRAIQELEQLRNEHPHDSTIRIQLGLLHYSQGNVLDAELEWETILDIDPTHREAIAYIEMAKKSRVQI